MTVLPSDRTTRAAKLASAGAARRAGIYTRVSQDASGVARSPREQETESRRDCERNGWDVVEVYCDNDRSASRHARKTRPAFAQLMADIGRGLVDIVVVWEASRLSRDLEAYAALAAVCRQADVKLSYNGRIFDLADPDDEFNVGLDMLLAQRESGTTRKRILRAVRANAEAGRPTGKVQTGYRRIYDPASGAFVRQEPDPDTAPIIREMFARIAAGDTLHGVAADLNRRNVPTKQGTTWTATKVRQTVESRSYLGHRTHRGDVVVENAWPALVDDVTFYRVQAIFNDPARKQHGRATGVVHLMSGLLACQRCGSTVSFTTVNSNGNGAQVYRCKAAGHVAIKATTLDAGVRLLIAEALARPDALAVFVPPDVNLAGVRAEHKALVARLDEADDALAAGHLEPRAHGVLERKLRPRIDELDATIRRARRDVPVPIAQLAEPLTADEVAARFDVLERDNLPAARLVVRTLLAECVLRPAPRRQRRPDLGLRFRWAGVGEVVEM